MNEIIKKNGVCFGFIFGLVSIAITSIIYITDVQLFLSGWITFLKVVIFTVIAIVLLTKTKKQLKGKYPFKEAFTTYFISAAIGILIATMFEIILFNFIEPALKDTLKEMSIKFTVNLLEKFGAKSSDINKAVAEMQNTDQFSIGQMIKGMFTYYVFAALFGLILAAIFKSKTPEYQ
jgi:hypothetical protein